MADNAAGFRALDDMIARLRAVPQMADAAAPELAEAVKGEIDAQIAAGVDPQGKAWTPTREGNRPLVNAAKAVTSKALGTVILITLGSPEVFHHFGAQGKPVRQVIPQEGGLPMKLGNAIRLGIVNVWNRTVAQGAKRSAYTQSGHKRKG